MDKTVITKTKYLLYAFKCKQKKRYYYWYETDNKYFKAKKPPKSILDKIINEITKQRYEDIDNITHDLSKLISDFLFIHPFREGNGRISRVICDIILAKNGFPMIGLNLKKEDNYIQRVHSGYNCDYEPMKELLKMKIEEEIMSE